MERERKIKRAKEREKKRGETGGEDVLSPSLPSFFFPALSLALFFARAPLSERLEQASLQACLCLASFIAHRE